jgi:hypothetical protein
LLCPLRYSKKSCWMHAYLDFHTVQKQGSIPSSDWSPKRLSTYLCLFTTGQKCAHLQKEPKKKNHSQNPVMQSTNLTSTVHCIYAPTRSSVQRELFQLCLLIKKKKPLNNALQAISRHGNMQNMNVKQGGARNKLVAREWSWAHLSKAPE